MTALGDHGPIAIVGAGPCGSLLAIYLADAGHDVTLYESRPDMRRVDISAGRSINLALATRGVVPLVEIGVIERVDAITIPMKGRMIHADGKSELTLQPYGSRPHEVIHSISRGDLNAILLDRAEETGRVTTRFEHRCRDVDFRRSVLILTGPDGETTEEPFGVVMGADGAGSAVRDAMLRLNGGNENVEPLGHGYKELTLPPKPGGGFQLDPNALHIWPRGEFMLIALANPEGDFTVTLFAPLTASDAGDVDSFEELQTTAQIQRFFETEFADFTPLVPDLVDQFLENPTGYLATARIDGWSLDDRAVVVGDAAHAIVPFHGQGMNLAMESARVLSQKLADFPADIGTAFALFEEQRKPNADAIADMALDNYIEMRSDVLDPLYVLKRRTALELERRHPEHLSPRYNMVMFTTMPYAEARARAERQADIIARLVEGKSAVADIDFEVAADLVGELEPLPDLDPLAVPDALSVT